MGPEDASSNWKPGAYLNVGLMFLWHQADRYLFEIGGQVEGFSPADSTDFGQAAHAKAERAAREIGTLRANFRSADDVIRFYARSQAARASTVTPTLRQLSVWPGIWSTAGVSLTAHSGSGTGPR